METIPRSAVHEAGHVVAAISAPHVVAVLEVIVDPIMGGRTAVGFAPGTHGTRPLEDAVIALAGHAAQRLVYGSAHDHSARDDIMRALACVLRARTLGIRCPWPEPDDDEIWALFWFDGADEETLRLLRCCYGKALAILGPHVPLLHTFALAATERGTLTYEEIRDMTKGVRDGF